MKLWKSSRLALNILFLAPSVNIHCALRTSAGNPKAPCAGTKPVAYFLIDATSSPLANLMVHLERLLLSPNDAPSIIFLSSLIKSGGQKVPVQIMIMALEEAANLIKREESAALRDTLISQLELCCTLLDDRKFIIFLPTDQEP